MENSKRVDPVLQENGSKPQTLTLGQVEGMVKRDVHGCLLLLQAIYEDVNVQKAVAAYIYGDYLNRKHKADLAKQTEVFEGIQPPE